MTGEAHETEVEIEQEPFVWRTSEEYALLSLVGCGALMLAGAFVIGIVWLLVELI